MCSEVVRNTLWVFGLAVSVAACRGQGSKNERGPAERAPAALPNLKPYVQSEIVVSTNGGFVDVSLPIVQTQPAADGTQRIYAAGKYRDRSIALTVRVSGAWLPQNVGSDISHVVYGGLVSFMRTDAGCDELPPLLDELYGTGLHPSGHLPEVAFSATTRDGSAPRLNETPARLLLSRSGEAEQSTVELFLNIDLPGRRLELAEKEPRYRAGLLRALGQF
jgi:hypothetical protein